MPETQASMKSDRASLVDMRRSITDLRGMGLLAESFNLATKYHGEYMDENPLIGEPGSFILQKSREVPTQSQSQSQVLSQSTNNSDIATKTSVPPIPAPLKTEGLPPEVRKGVKGGEKTPITPGTRDKKKKKSKNVTTTPK